MKINIDHGRRLFLLTAACFTATLLAHSFTRAQDQNGWVGKVFQPEQCLKLETGEFEVRRKLCTIKYSITQQKNHFEIVGYLRFNNRFVPKKPQRVELDILFMDDQYTCRRQLTFDTPVVELPLVFTAVADYSPDQRYIRTYYTLYYD